MVALDYLQGESSLVNLIVMGIGYVILAGMMSINGPYLQMTGSMVWVRRSFFNNLASNLVHVVSNSEADSLNCENPSMAIVHSIVLWGYQKRKLIANPCYYNQLRFSMPMYEF
ncbi:MAG: hypothetical protein ACLS5K_04965 [Streptococcus salivarius]